MRKKISIRREPTLSKFEKYAVRLLSYDIRLSDIPRKVYERGMFGYLVTAFRADRLSKHLYQEDLAFVKSEIEKARQAGDTRLQQSLERFYREKADEMDIVFPRK